MYPVLILTHVPDFLDTSGMGVTELLNVKVMYYLFPKYLTY